MPAKKFRTPKFLLFRIHQDLQLITSYNIGEDSTPITNLERLVLVLEDRRFFAHSGCDFFAVMREAAKMLTGRKFGGASTIDMQFVRTVTGYCELTVKRKIYEIMLAYFLQYRMSKLEILRSYLAIVYLGTGLGGIDAACDHLYAKYPSDLSDEEAAKIAAMMVYPKPRVANPSWKKKVDRRAKYGLARLSSFNFRYK